MTKDVAMPINLYALNVYLWFLRSQSYATPWILETHNQVLALYPFSVLPSSPQAWPLPSRLPGEIGITSSLSVPPQACPGETMNSTRGRSWLPLGASIFINEAMILKYQSTGHLHSGFPQGDQKGAELPLPLGLETCHHCPSFCQRSDFCIIQTVMWTVSPSCWGCLRIEQWNHWFIWKIPQEIGYTAHWWLQAGRGWVTPILPNSSPLDLY